MVSFRSLALQRCCVRGKNLERERKRGEEGVVKKGKGEGEMKGRRGYIFMGFFTSSFNEKREEREFESIGKRRRKKRKKPKEKGIERKEQTDVHIE